MRKSKIWKKAVALVMALMIAFPLMSPLSDLFQSNTVASAASATLNVKTLWENKKASLKDSSGNTWFNGDTFQHWTDTSGTDVVWVDSTGASKNTAYNTGVANDVDLYYVSSLSTTSTAGDSVSTHAYGKESTTPSLYYTVSIGEDGYLYPTYYISTARQLKHFLQQNPEKLWKGSSVTDSNGNVGKKKIAVKLLCDIDLGGTESTTWKFSTKSTSKWNSYTLDIDGDGHTIYNGYFGETGFLPAGSIRYVGLSIRNVTFSNMFLNQNYGLFGNNVEHMYLYNVDFTDCYAVGTSCTTIVLGNTYNYCFIKECTVKNSYIYSSVSDKTTGHGGLFGSYNGTGSGSAYTTIPGSLSDIEEIWSGSDKDNYPVIFEDCQAIDSECYFNGESRHQGVFVSCTQGGEIFRRCLSNCTAYGSRQIGVFIGACIGSANGFTMTIDGETLLVNTYFEDCFTSGVIEGTKQIGGFIGMIFDDDRADGDNGTGKSQRGICYFKNCYSTSSVGMQYSGSYIGGFVGYVRANYEASDGVQSHRFVNCYAAGEVGGIATETTNDGNTATIGGFMGVYDDGYKYSNVSQSTSTIVPVAENCYYDMQTTAMRERDIGGTNLYGTMKGLTGVYTTKSNSKGVLGLTDTEITDLFGSNSNYTRVTEYYPQIKSMLYSTAAYDELEDSNENVQTMLTNRIWIKKYYSLASTATVFLNHYDQTLSTEQSGAQAEIYVAADKTTYDTVRDITSIFTFTSTLDAGYELGITWEKNETLNTAESFTNYLGGVTTVNNTETGKGFSLSYSYTDTSDTTSTYEKTFRPEVLDMIYTESKYQCIRFAPGKQWVQVQVGAGTIGSGDTENTITDGQAVIGKRNLRLLPTAYIDAGDTVTITIGKTTTDEGEQQENYSVLLKEIIYDNGEHTMTTFNHVIGVSYAISDKYRMVDTDSYTEQTVTEYSGGTDTSSFAISGKYRVDDGESKIDSTIDGVFHDQLFSDLGQDNTSDASGMTMVKVWEAETDESNVLQDKTYINVSSGTTNSEKWSGTEKFTDTETGYYYLHYYWRLDDGRYLSDIKLVQIKTTAAYIEMRTGVLKSSLPDGKSDIIALHDIDQYVDTEASSTEIDNTDLETWDTSGTGTDAIYWKKTYPTKQTNYSDATAATDYYNGDNGDKIYHDNSEFTYSVKSILNVTASASNVVGWYNSADYKMTTLILEVSDGTSWTEMTRIDVGKNAGNVYNLNEAQYQATFKISEVSQDKKTRKYTVNYVNGGNQTVSFTVQTFSVKTYDAANGHKVSKTSDGKVVEEERYIVLNVTNTSTSGDSLAATNISLQNPIRVTALYQKAEADITPQKEVLLSDETLDSVPYPTPTTVTSNVAVASGTTNYYYTDSLQGMDDDRSMDNGETQSKDDSSSHAVLEGDTLTYRVRLKNLGYNPATNINLPDLIPDGCTYVADSAKVYSQTVDFTSDVIKYGPVNEEKEAGIDLKYDDSGGTGALTVDFGEVGIDFKKEYYVYFQVKVNALAANVEKREINNTVSIKYQNNGDGIVKKAISNEVSTDQVHLYFKIQKTISEADVGRSFLYEVKRYAESDDKTPTDTYYVDLSFDDASATTDEDGNTIYTVEKILQTDSDGRYEITEVNSWSSTDYQENSETEKVSLIRENKLTFHTNKATDEETYEMADFTNQLDAYAYRDSQAYVENQMQVASNKTEEDL